jgi:hypothetical protein
MFPRLVWLGYGWCGIAAHPQKYPPTLAWLHLNVTGRWWTERPFVDSKLELTRWTVADVYGRPWMAPRAVCGECW